MYILHLLILYLSMKWNDNPMHSGQGAFDEYGYLMKTALSTLILHQMNSWRCLFTKWHMWVGGSVFRKHTMLGKNSINEKWTSKGRGYTPTCVILWHQHQSMCWCHCQSKKIYEYWHKCWTLYCSTLYIYWHKSRVQICFLVGLRFWFEYIR